MKKKKLVHYFSTNMTKESVENSFDCFKNHRIMMNEVDVNFTIWCGKKK